MNSAPLIFISLAYTYNFKENLKTHKVSAINIDEIRPRDEWVLMLIWNFILCIYTYTG